MHCVLFTIEAAIHHCPTLYISVLSSKLPLTIKSNGLWCLNWPAHADIIEGRLNQLQLVAVSGPVQPLDKAL